MERLEAQISAPLPHPDHMLKSRGKTLNAKLFLNLQIGVGIQIPSHKCCHLGTEHPDQQTTLR